MGSALGGAVARIHLKYSSHIKLGKGVFFCDEKVLSLGMELGPQDHQQAVECATKLQDMGWKKARPFKQTWTIFKIHCLCIYMLVY